MTPTYPLAAGANYLNTCSYLQKANEREHGNFPLPDVKRKGGDRVVKPGRESVKNRLRTKTRRWGCKKSGKRGVAQY
jgi:hypothetical protein